MKKTLKIALLVAFMAVILFALTGCGNKLVVTKEEESMGMKMKEETEISFKNDKINKAKTTYTFDDKDTASGMKAFMTLGTSMSDDYEGIEIKQSGKKIIIEYSSAEAFANMNDVDEDITKDELKEHYEENEYKVK